MKLASDLGAHVAASDGDKEELRGMAVGSAVNCDPLLFLQGSFDGGCGRGLYDGRYMRQILGSVS